mmetsp:Transcript_56834/g.152232  ORF Transcript_56834/g.152232 Transcript_56834/m.152232 type:complete len:1084 (-) Transcript_56834:117-3368(-)|eukprot:CAMPEP_0171172078 /NCGR_PEP_ID=MMETSP0790-20130122/9540_1 /TAXON_ID=2925 /ORGANISM="Alexandrium catenella, Strain OF101" /LENGTH=1083 /DNA_ID=CAMNT_0011636937 /DNA_START=51 /DNA_END=3302 /DNA_ORIENTATION=+
MARAPLVWAAACILGVRAIAYQPEDAFGLIQTELVASRGDLAPHRAGSRPKNANRKGGNKSAAEPNAAGAHTSLEDRHVKTANASTGNSSDPNASAVNASAPNASAGNASDANASATNSTLPATPSAPAAAFDGLTENGWCGYEAQKGFLTAYTKPASDTFLIDLTEAFERNSTIRFVVTAMTVSGTYADGEGYIMEYASPMEETANTMFELRLNPDNISVDVFKPQLELRTSDAQSLAALKRGAGSGRFQNLGTYRCAQHQAGSFVLQGTSTAPAGERASAVSFHRESSLMDSLLQQDHSSTQDVLLAKGEAQLEASSAPLIAATAVSSASASRRTIINGGNLIKAGFFVAPSMKQAEKYRLRKVKVYKQNIDVTVEYSVNGDPIVVGFSLVQLPAAPMRPRPADDRLLYFTTDYRDLGEHSQFQDELPEESVDRKVSTIWRYNLDNLPDNQIKIHIDPTVPKRWRKWFKLGVEAWNEAYGLIGKPNAVRAMLPDDEDWPKDYDVSDARFSTISWTISSEVVSMGVAKVDPRSGEILKSDIIMSDGWVQAWLGDLDLLAPNFTHTLIETKGIRFEARSDASVYLGRKRVPRRLKVRKEGEEWGKKISLLALARGEPLKKTERNDIIGQGLQDVVTHETGHILGLRHNFKGSLGVTYACVRSPSCSAVHGLTASVMDYVPVNLPTAEEPDVHLFTPVLGGYDKLAIKYGYMEVNSSAAGQPGRTFLEPELRQVLREAEKYETCYDADRVAGQDPSCQAYDISSDPLQAYEDELKRLVAVQANLLNTSVMPGAPYTHYGQAVDQVLLLSRGIGIKLVGWIGGVQNSYINRHLDGSRPSKVARKPLSEDVQKRALSLLVQLLRPAKAGLLPPPESMPYLVAASEGSGSVQSVDLEGHVRSVVRTLMSHALDPDQLLRLHAQERLEASLKPAESAEGDEHDYLSVRTFMRKFVRGVVGDGLSSSNPSEWELHRLLVKGLDNIHKSGTLPGSVRAHAAHHLMKLRLQAEEELSKIELSQLESSEDGPQQSELLQAHLAGMHQQLTSAICGNGLTKGCIGLESGAAHSARLGAILGALAVAFGALRAH